MRNVLWICAAVASALTLVDARAEGDGLSADADRVPWARFQSRIAYAARRARLARRPRAARSGTGLQVGSVGLLGDVYFGSTPAPRAASVGGFRATSGLLIGARSTGLGAVSTPTSGLLATDRRLFGASAAPLDAIRPIRRVDSTTRALHRHRLQQPVGARAAGSFSADLGVVSQSPGNVVRFGRVFGGSQSLDDVVRDMRLAPVVQLGVSYSF